MPKIAQKVKPQSKRSPRKPPTEAQRNYRSAATFEKKREGYRRVTRTYTEVGRRGTAQYKEGLREKAYSKQLKDRLEARQDIHAKALERQQAGAASRREAVVSRRRYAARTEATEALPGGAPTPLSAPNVSYLGGFARLFIMAIGLIVLYAIVTHSTSSAGAIGKTGNVVVKITDKQPLFQKTG